MTVYEPTAQEILENTAAIRATWPNGLQPAPRGYSLKSEPEPGIKEVSYTHMSSRAYLNDADTMA